MLSLTRYAAEDAGVMFGTNCDSCRQGSPSEKIALNVLRIENRGVGTVVKLCDGCHADLIALLEVAR